MKHSGDISDANADLQSLQAEVDGSGLAAKAPKSPKAGQEPPRFVTAKRSSAMLSE